MIVCAFHGWVGHLQSLQRYPLHILCPRCTFSCDLGIQGWPWSATWTLFAMMFCGFAYTLAAQVRHVCCYGHPGSDLEATCLKSDVLAPCCLCCDHGKTDVSTESHFCFKFALKSSPKGSQGHLWVPFWRHLGSCCRLFGVPWCGCGRHVGLLWIQCDFVGQGTPQELVGGKGGATFEASDLLYLLALFG